MAPLVLLLRYKNITAAKPALHAGLAKIKLFS